MRVEPIDNNWKYNQSNIPFKAYIKPNTNFHILYGQDKGANARLVKQLSELPNHCIEILKLNKLKTIFDNTDGSESFLDKIEAIILNQKTKQTANIIIEHRYQPLNSLLEQIIGLKDKLFFKYEMGAAEAAIYETMTTGKPLNKFYTDNIEKYYPDK